MEWIHRYKLKHKYGFEEKEIEKFKNLNGSSISGIEERFISLARYNSLRNYLDNPRWRAIIHNKWITANYFNSVGIPIPKTHGLLQPIYGKTTEGEPLTGADDLLKLIQKLDSRNLALKHIGGGMGDSVYITDKITIKNGAFELETISGTHLRHDDINRLLKQMNGGLFGYIVQDRVQQHSALTKITSGGLSSIRIYTFWDKMGKSRSRLAMIGFGLPGKPTDHSVNGGIMAEVDCDSGIVSKGVQISESEKFISHHPVSGIKFEGFEVPYWHQVRELAERAAQNCPALNWVGWDLVVTPDGPVLLEGNVGDKTVFLSQLLFGGYLENGIFKSWMNNLDLPEEELKNYNALKEWKIRYLKKTVKKFFRL